MIAARRPRLLFLGQTLPFPPDGGVHIRMYHVLRLLAREFEIHALFFYRRSERESDAAVRAGLDGLRGIARVEAFPIPQEQSRARLVWDHGRSVLRRRAYTLYAYESSAFRARLAHLLATVDYDVVHVDSLDLAAYLPMVVGRRTTCTHHNIESQLLRRRAQSERVPWRRGYLSWQARLVERLEQRWYPRVALNVVVSDNDRQTIADVAPDAPVAVVPNGVDVAAFRPEPGREEGLVFVGGANWFPNRDALDYFGQEILPSLRSHSPDAVPVRWVGRCSESDRAHWADRYGIELTGYVDDVRPYIRDAACYVVPLRVGGGTRLKILDAWSMGKAVVSTSIGCEGLAATDGGNILIRDTPQEFATAVSQVLKDRTLRERLGRAARQTVERSYSWDVIGDALNRLYLPLPANGVPVPTGM